MPGHRSTTKTPVTFRLIASRTVRAVLAIVLIGAGVAMFIFNGTVRAWEAALAAVTTGWVIPGLSGALRDTVYYGLGEASPRGLEITLLCSTVIILGPILIMGGLVVILRRFSIVGALKGIAAALVIIVTANLIRIGLIAFSWDRWGATGFNATHLGFGSIFALLAFAGGLVVFLKLALVKKRAMAV